jgi:hypothetical protein
MPIETATDEPTESQEEEPQTSAPQNSAAALPLSRIRDKLRAIRQRATDAGILVRVNEPSDGRPALTPKFMPVSGLEPLAETCSPKFTIPQGSRTVRLAAFSAWAREVLRDNGGHVLVMSDDGEVLWSDEAKAGLLLSSMMAWAAAARACARSACGTRPVVRQALSSGHVLTVHDIRIDCDSDVVLLKVSQLGHEPGIACHTGRHSCFFQSLQADQWQATEPVLKDPETIYK